MPPGVQDKRTWSGRAAIDVGIGVFEGQSGDNREHCHWAHQLSTGLEGTIDIISNGQCHRAPSFFIRAGTPHQLVPGAVRSVYLDPTSSVSHALCARLDREAGIIILPSDLTELLNVSFRPPYRIEEGMEQFRQALQGPHEHHASDKLQAVLARLQQGVQGMNIPDRQSLAQLAGLSESRFSHWFCERTGMPLRNYRKWLRLIYGLQQVLQGQKLTDAAYLAQFSDQAHFTRTFVQMFGVRPSDLLVPIEPSKNESLV